MEAESPDLAFTGELWTWRGPSPYHFITVPDEVSVGLRAISSVVTYGWGMIPVRYRIGATKSQTSLFPKDGRVEGDVVTVWLSVRT